MSTYVMLLFGSNFISPLIAGWMDDGIGWRWTMHAGAIIAAVAFIVLFFGMEETMYFRHTLEGIEVETPPEILPELTKGVEKPDQKSSTKSGAESPTVSDDAGVQPSCTPPRTARQKLMPFVRWPGRPTVKQTLTMMWRPLLIIVRFPNIAWSGFIYGINLSW